VKPSPSIYVRKRDPEQPLWRWIAVTDYPVPLPLRFLAREHQLFIGPDAAMTVLEWLRDEGFGDDEPGAPPMPVEIVDLRGRRVDPTDLPAAA
jgi:hypothetical protein